MRLYTFLSLKKTSDSIIMEFLTPPEMRFSCDESQISKFFNHVPIKGLGRSFEIMSESSEESEKSSSIISIDFL